jgi:hypothetical protein
VGSSKSDGTPVIVGYSGAAPDTVNGVVQINLQVTASQAYYLGVKGIDSDIFGIFTTP